ncbi:unnamed protein product, partial [Scytosiphon promiscuus]
AQATTNTHARGTRIDRRGYLFTRAPSLAWTRGGLPGPGLLRCIGSDTRRKKRSTQATHHRQGESTAGRLVPRWIRRKGGLALPACLPLTAAAMVVTEPLPPREATAAAAAAVPPLPRAPAGRKRLHITRRRRRQRPRRRQHRRQAVPA